MNKALIQHEGLTELHVQGARSLGGERSERQRRERRPEWFGTPPH